MVRHAKGGLWSLTPLGRQKAVDLVGDVDVGALEVELAHVPGALFGNQQHPLIDPAFAPARWRPAIGRLLDRFPLESNVFCMTRFPSEERPDDQPLAAVVETLREVCKRHALNLHLASDRQIEDDLLGNVGGYMWACRYGIGLLEDRARHGLNYNVVIEVGAMLMTGRRCALLKDSTAPNLPTDLAGQIYKSVDFDNLGDVSEAAHVWIAEDLSLGRCEACPSKP